MLLPELRVIQKNDEEERKRQHESRMAGQSTQRDQIARERLEMDKNTRKHAEILSDMSAFIAAQKADNANDAAILKAAREADAQAEMKILQHHVYDINIADPDASAILLKLHSLYPFAAATPEGKALMQAADKAIAPHREIYKAAMELLGPDRVRGYRINDPKGGFGGMDMMKLTDEIAARRLQIATPFVADGATASMKAGDVTVQLKPDNTEQRATEQRHKETVATIRQRERELENIRKENAVAPSPEAVAEMSRRKSEIEGLRKSLDAPVAAPGATPADNSGKTPDKQAGTMSKEQEVRAMVMGSGAKAPATGATATPQGPYEPGSLKGSVSLKQTAKTAGGESFYPASVLEREKSLKTEMESTAARDASAAKIKGISDAIKELKPYTTPEAHDLITKRIKSKRFPFYEPEKASLQAIQEIKSAHDAFGSNLRGHEVPDDLIPEIAAAIQRGSEIRLDTTEGDLKFYENDSEWPIAPKPVEKKVTPEFGSQKE